MPEEQYFTGKAPAIEISQCQGDLVIRSGMETAVTIKGSDFTAVETEFGLTVNSLGDLKLHLPPQASIAIQHVNGDLVIKNITGDISLHEINGDVVLVNVGNVKISAINSDLSAKNLQAGLSIETIRGDAAIRNANEIAIQTVQGDLSARNVNGPIHLMNVAGDIGLRTVNGDVTIEKGQRDVNLRNLGGINNVTGIVGDIRLRGGLTAGEHLFVAERDIIVRWPAGAPLDFSATAPKIVNRLTVDKVVEGENSLTGRIGDGDTVATFQANGRIILKEGNIVDPKWESAEGNDMDFDFDFGFGNIGLEISSQINEQFNRFTEQFGSKFARKAEEAARKAEQAAERARQRAERQGQYAQQRTRQCASRSYGPTAKSAQKAATASKEEQLKILRMVEKGIITPAEATTLLDALET
ncbi:MAG: hypothetical protein HF973_04270 [Chloroflexi bacterium]|nr:hypothetical protein [Chloroflexota bacterium]